MVDNERGKDEPSASTDGLTRLERDSRDLNDEYAGRETGRQKRFLNNAATQTEEVKQRKEREFTALMRLLLNPDYARLYGLTQQAVARADDAVQGVLNDAELKAQRAMQTASELREHAAQLADGTRVFRSKRDGLFYSEKGRSCSSNEVATLNGASSWEDLQAAKEEIEYAKSERSAIERYRRDILGPARSRLEDANNPPSAEKLEEIGERLEADMPQAVKAKYQSPFSEQQYAGRKASAADEYVGGKAVAAPDVHAEFNTKAPPNTAAAPQTGLVFEPGSKR